MAGRGPITVLVGVLAASAMSGCITGERPSLSESANAAGQPTGDAAVDAVLDLLDVADSAQFSAEYTILTRFGGGETDAEVVQRSPERRTVTIGDVQFRIDGANTSTCPVGSRHCSSHLQDERISDVQVTHRFYAEEAAIRLRQDAAARIGTTQAEATEIAGRPATCVSIPLSGGTVRYCALDSGVLALIDDADVRVELTSYNSLADPKPTTD